MKYESLHGTALSMSRDLSQHPCFNKDVRHVAARIHLPVAPHCNIQCNYCKRGFDCVNESRPGVTSVVLAPGQALHYLEETLRREPRIRVVGIAGPGDPFANSEETLETLRLVRQRFPEMLLCVASNGLQLAPHAEEMAALGVSHVTLTVNAVDPEIGAKIYAWVRDGKRVHRGLDAATLLWERQLQAIEALKNRGVIVKINTILVPGINEGHIAEVARCMAALGADIFNCVPLYPVAGSPFGDLEQPSPQSVAAIRAEAALYLPIMEHCTRCRADAVGLLGEAVSPETTACLRQAAALPLNPQQERPYVAAASLEGVLVNQHLGEASELAIFAQENGGFRLVETRPTPAPGGGQDRWLALAKTLGDCRALLVSSAGETPQTVLTAQGVRVILMEGLIEDGLAAVYRGLEIRAPLRQHRCGVGCSGNGQGCM